MYLAERSMRTFQRISSQHFQSYFLCSVFLHYHCCSIYSIRELIVAISILSQENISISQEKKGQKKPANWNHFLADEYRNNTYKYTAIIQRRSHLCVILYEWFTNPNIWLPLCNTYNYQHQVLVFLLTADKSMVNSNQSIVLYPWWLPCLW